jgi:hypothetical protein
MSVVIPIATDFDGIIAMSGLYSRDKGLAAGATCW